MNAPADKEGSSGRHQSGVTLIEVLVALLVLSIGLIGVAALQANALQANHGSQLRSQATNLAYDISDRMRTNRQAALNGDYVGQFNAATCPSSSAEIPNPTGSLANRDLTEWQVALACGLPAGRGEISRSGDEFVITIRWNNERLAEDASEQTEVFVTRTEI